MIRNIIGTCSVCGGAVTVPVIWHGIYPPTPTCSSCGRRPQRSHGPVIEMEPLSPTERRGLQERVRLG